MSNVRVSELQRIFIHQCLVKTVIHKLEGFSGEDDSTREVQKKRGRADLTSKLHKVRPD